jgi:hypothetical protein
MGRLSLVRSVGIVVCVASAAMAQPKPARIPTRPVPCLKDDPQLLTSGTDAVICWTGGCMKLDMGSTDATPIAKPTTQKWTLPVAEVKDDQVCLGASCKPLGKKLVAAIADAKKNADANRPLAFQATTDLKLVVWGGAGGGAYGAWSVKDDKALVIPPPPKDPKDPNKRGVTGATVVGNLIVFGWISCAGPCSEYSIIDSAGRPKGVQGRGGGPVLQLDDKRFVVISEYGDVNVHDIGTGKRLSSFELASEPVTLLDAARIDDGSIFVMLPKSGGRVVSKISLPNSKTKPRVADSMFLPSCTP